MDVDLPAGQVRWLAAQERSGESIGDTDTHAIFIELNEPGPGRFIVGRHFAGPERRERVTCGPRCARQRRQMRRG